MAAPLPCCDDCSTACSGDLKAAFLLFLQNPSAQGIKDGYLWPAPGKEARLAKTSRKQRPPQKESAQSHICPKRLAPPSLNKLQRCANAVALSFLWGPTSLPRRQPNLEVLLLASGRAHPRNPNHLSDGWHSLGEERAPPNGRNFPNSDR